MVRYEFVGWSKYLIVFFIVVYLNIILMCDVCSLELRESLVRDFFFVLIREGIRNILLSLGCSLVVYCLVNMCKGFGFNF